MNIQLAKSLLAASVITALASGLGACGSSPYADYSQSELQDAYSNCESNDSMSPGAAITCDNIRRECNSRAKDKGRKVCF